MESLTGNARPDRYQLIGTGAGMDDAAAVRVAPSVLFAGQPFFIEGGLWSL